MSQPGGIGEPSNVLAGLLRLKAWRNAVFLLFGLSGVSTASWVARLPAIRDDLQLSTASIGLLIFGLACGSIIGLGASPYLLARLGPRTGIVLSLMLIATGLVGVGASATLVPLPALTLISLVIFGFGSGSVDVMMNLEGAACERAIGRTLLPLMHAFFSFGTVVGAGIGIGASAGNLPVFWHLTFMAIVIAVSVVIAVRFLPSEVAVEKKGAEKTRWFDRLRAIWADSRLLMIGLVILGMAFAEGSANDWLALAVVDGHNQDNTTGALVFGVFVAAMTIGRIIGGPVLDRFGRVPVLRASAILGTIGLVLFILSPVLWLIIVGAALWGLGCSLGFPVGISAAADDPHKAAARVSAVAAIGYCAFLAGPPVLGFLGQWFGILNALFVVLALLLLATLAAPAARERTNRFAP